MTPSPDYIIPRHMTLGYVPSLAGAEVKQLNYTDHKYTMITNLCQLYISNIKQLLRYMWSQYLCSNSTSKGMRKGIK